MDKSTKFQMRIDAELLAAIDAQSAADGMTRTEFMVRAARARLANAPSLDGSSRLPIVPQSVRSIPAVQPASSIPAPTERTNCPRCGATLIPWGPHKRCDRCKTNFPPTI